MLETQKPLPNSVPWIGFFIALAALGCNFVLLLAVPGQRVIPWLSLLLAGLALFFLVKGVRRAYSRTEPHRGKITSVLLGIVAGGGCCCFVFLIVLSGRGAGRR